MESVVNEKSDFVAECLEELETRHRQETKTLQTRTMQLKKAVTKGDNKKKKQVAAEVQKMEQELKEKHKLEMENFVKTNESNAGATTTSTSHVEEDTDKEKEIPHKVSKAQKRRERKAQEQKVKDEQIDAEMKHDRMNSQKTKELESLDQRLTPMKLQIFDIPADGDCLYAAVAHQLLQMSVSTSTTTTVSELRSQCAKYMREHSDEFLAFLTNQDDDPLDEEGFEKYCNNVEGKNGPIWGGAVELGALSKMLGLKIRVLQADAEDLLFGEERSGEEELVIVYHRHAFRLGEHYNSTLKLE